MHYAHNEDNTDRLIEADDRNTGGNLMLLKCRTSMMDDALPPKPRQELVAAFKATGLSGS